MIQKLIYTIKVLIVVAFAMAAGMGIHNQYIMANQPARIHVEPVVMERVVINQCVEDVTLVARAKEEVTACNYDSIELIELCVEAEAGNQSLTGRRMVVDVILNRVDDEEFPNTVYEVITQPNQFKSYWDGNMDSITEISELTREAVRMELDGERLNDEIFYFRTKKYHIYGNPWGIEGDHYFNTK